jgi:hypothetical protein
MFAVELFLCCLRYGGERLRERLQQIERKVIVSCMLRRASADFIQQRVQVALGLRRVDRYKQVVEGHRRGLR